MFILVFEYLYLNLKALKINTKCHNFRLSILSLIRELEVMGMRSDAFCVFCSLLFPVPCTHFTVLLLWQQDVYCGWARPYFHNRNDWWYLHEWMNEQRGWGLGQIRLQSGGGRSAVKYLKPQTASSQQNYSQLQRRKGLKTTRFHGVPLLLVTLEKRRFSWGVAMTRVVSQQCSNTL